MRTNDEAGIGPTLLDEYLFGDPAKALSMTATLSGMLARNINEQSR
jgi:hypothetical protein